MPPGSNNRFGDDSTVRYTPVMAGSTVPYHPPNVQEYLALEEDTTVRHEYVAGTIHAQAGATKRHNWIALNIVTRLASSACGGSCRVYASDVKLRVADDVFYYPDVMAACGPEGEDPIYEDAPCLVVEVIAPSIASIDRREKLIAYRQIPTLKAYLIAAQESRRVERHWRDESGEWFQGEATDDNVIPIPCPETKLPLDEIYEGL